MSEVMVPIELTIGPVRVSFEHIGEGYSGEYNPNDPEDRRLLRFYIEERDEDGDWNDVDNGSFCTTLTTDTSIKDLVNYLTLIWGRVWEKLLAGESIKRECEKLSWLGSGTENWR